MWRKLFKKEQNDEGQRGTGDEEGRPDQAEQAQPVQQTKTIWAWDEGRGHGAREGRWMRIQGTHTRLNRQDTARILFTVAARYRHESGAHQNDLQNAIQGVCLNSDLTTSEIESIMHSYLAFWYETDARPS